MKNLFLCHPTCTTCKKAREWLAGQGIPCGERDIREPNPSAAELVEWVKRSGLPPRKMFNTSGMQYRALNLSARLPDMSDAEQIALLASDGMLVKRPVMVAGNGKVLFGFKEAQWAEAFGKENA
jgi:arsenate reductase